MEFRIADTFTSSLGKLPRDEQRIAKTSAFDLQLNPANPGLKFHRLDKVKDPNFWSIRCNRDLRIIVHKTSASLMLCYVDHHDKAYKWAERRKIEIHPKTGAAQLVEVRETVQEITIPKYVEVEQPKPALFADVPPDDLLTYGVPLDWLDDVRKANEDTLFEICEHLPAEASEALLNLAVGSKPPMAADVAELFEGIESVAKTSANYPAVAEESPGFDQQKQGEPTPAAFEHPDAKRRFRVIKNVAELERAMDYPWEKWTVFLHPSQTALVERDFKGPARVAGSAGTGKTIVALHRAAFLAKQNPQAKVLLTTFSDTLASSLRIKLERLVGNEAGILGRIHVRAIDAVGIELFEQLIGTPHLATIEHIRESISSAAGQVADHKFTEQFLLAEWTDVVDAWQLTTWEEYRDVARLGRKTRLGEKQRQLAWQVFDKARAELERRGLHSMSWVFHRVAAALATENPYDFAIVDEAQDINVPQLRFIASLGAVEPNRLFFAGDLGQRIFQSPFSWKSLGVDVRGRSTTLRINYRTSHQIRSQADKLLPNEISDVDGNKENRKGTVSVFNGPFPTIERHDYPNDESDAVGRWIAEQVGSDVQPEEIGIFVRSAEQLPRAIAAVTSAGLKHVELTESLASKPNHVSICTMHLAKGLEFRSVVVMACDDEVIPLQERIETVTDDSDLEEVYNTERHLLYVACTRARENLLVSGVEPASEFLDDLRG